MACQEVITNVPPVGQAKPASRHNGGGFVRFENCGSWDFWIHDVNANCNSIYNLAKINCIPLIDFLTTPLQVDVDANGHTIYNVGKILIGSSTDDGSGALLQVAGEINAQSYMLGGYEFASYATPGQIDLSNIYSINGVTGFLPAGPEGSIQYNDDGNFAGDSFFVYDENTHNVGIVPLGLGPQWRLDVGGDINIIDPTYTGYAYRINGIPFAVADPGGSHINLVNIGLINGAPPGGGGGGGALPGGQPGDIQFNVSGGLFGGSQNFFWDNTNNRLGIGTSSPAYPLDIVGNENITGCYYIANVPFACQSGSGIALQNIVTINGGPPGGAATLPGAPSGSVQYNQNNVFTGSVNLTWDWTNNRLGVGTFAPGYPLDVAGNVNARGCYLISGLTFACSDGAGGINLTNITNINGQPPGTGGGASVTVSDTPPASPSLGNLWFDSVGTQLYIWYTDPTSSQWVATINQCSGGSGGGGGTTNPGLPLTSVQWNNNNTFGGSQAFLWDDPNTSLNIGLNVNTNNARLGSIGFYNQARTGEQRMGVISGVLTASGTTYGGMRFQIMNNGILDPIGIYMGPSNSGTTLNLGLIAGGQPINVVRTVGQAAISLTTNNSGTFSGLQGYTYTGTGNVNAAGLKVSGFTARGSSTGVNPSQAGDMMIQLEGYGYDSTNWQRGATIQMITESGWVAGTSFPSSITFSTTTAISMAERVRITSAGYVGIGNTAPSYQLDVTGLLNTYVARFTNSGSFSGIIIDHTQTSGGETVVSFRSGGAETAVIEYDSDEDNLIFWTGQKDAGESTLCCTGNNQVGIMTTSPFREFHVANVTAGGGAAITGSAPSLILSNADSGLEPNQDSMGAIFALSTSAGNYQLPAGSLVVATQGLNRGDIYIEPNYTGTGNHNVIMCSLRPGGAVGHVGIGTATPGNALCVAKDAAITTSGMGNAQVAITGATSTTKTLWLGFDTTSNVGVIQAGVSGASWNSLLLNPDGGNVGIQNVNPIYQLDVAGNINCTAGYLLNGAPHLMLTPAEYADLQNLLARVANLEARLGG